MIDLSKVEVEDFLERLDVENIGVSGVEAMFSCPFPDHDRGDINPSAAMNIETTAWQCFSCKRKGNAVTFLSELEDLNNYESESFIRDQYHLGYRSAIGSMVKEWEDYFNKREKIEEVRERPPEEKVEEYYVDWKKAYDKFKKGTDNPIIRYLFDRGFKHETLQKYEIGYDEKSERFTIPIREADRTLVGFKGRAWSEERKPKYLNMGDRPGKPIRYGYDPYEIGKYIYGLHNTPTNPEVLIVCEGELNVLALDQLGWDNGVALGGSNPTKTQGEILKWNTDRVICFLDSDHAGSPATFRLIEMLECFIRVGFVPTHEEDPAGLIKEYGDIEARKEVEFLLRNVTSSLTL